MNIKNERVEQLAEEVARLTGETKTAAILRALEERRDRVARQGRAGRPQLTQVLDFLENEFWSGIPQKFLGRRIAKSERERILGYGRSGV